jgi:hypothetical protein
MDPTSTSSHVEDNGDRPVVDELDLHAGTEHPRRTGTPRETRLSQNRPYSGSACSGRAAWVNDGRFPVALSTSELTRSDAPTTTSAKSPDAGRRVIPLHGVL